MSHFKTLAGAAALSLFSSAAFAVVIDPDAFADGTDISNAFSGVTLSTVFAGVGDPAIDITGTGAVYSHTTGTASTGTRGFAHSVTNELWGNGSFEYLRADFAAGASSVSLDFINNDNSDNNAELLAFDGMGNLVDSMLFAANLNGPETLTVSGNISYVFAYWDQANRLDNGALDNLQYTAAVPLPAAMPLMIGAFGAMGIAARRRKARKA
ncbi:MAG: VPLPA-CTERM sorting domain-containing protein [Sedimentitalea sp.]